MPVKKAKVPVQKGKIKPRQVTAKMMMRKAEVKEDAKDDMKRRSGMLPKKK